MYFFKEPTLSNDSTTVEYNYYWLNTDTINSDGSTYADPDFGSNHLEALTNSVNTRTYFGKFDLTIEQREGLQEFTKSYDKQGMYELNFFYGKLGEISSTYMLVFDGRPFCVFCLFYYFFILIFGFLLKRVQNENVTGAVEFGSDHELPFEYNNIVYF